MSFDSWRVQSLLSERIKFKVPLEMVGAGGGGVDFNGIAQSLGSSQVAHHAGVYPVPGA